MNKPILVIMAAGMGSRFGGLKQMAKVDEQGHVIMDFSLFDARRAGFEKAVCIIKPEMKEDFEALIGSRVRRFMELEYAFQNMNALPEGYAVPEGRIKPWGTTHAVLAAKDLIGDSPFAVINADDFYGKEAYEAIYAYLKEPHAKGEYAMVGYLLKNTVTDNGHVARGVCQVDGSDMLTGIQERLRIEKRNGGIAFTEDEGQTYTDLDPEDVVSMNFWGYMPDFLQEAQARFPAFLDENLPKNPLKCEYLVPRLTDDLIKEGKATVKVLHCGAKWHGVTYQQDMPELQQSIRDMKAAGLYPDYLWK
ncbi:MAG: nucleotidyltransferase [Clostridia bacterium]|nr:nucleotidyltransferase [Clostridia bacterium]